MSRQNIHCKSADYTHGCQIYRAWLCAWMPVPIGFLLELTRDCKFRSIYYNNQFIIDLYNIENHNVLNVRLSGFLLRRLTWNVQDRVIRSPRTSSSDLLVLHLLPPPRTAWWSECIYSDFLGSGVYKESMGSLQPNYLSPGFFSGDKLKEITTNESTTTKETEPEKRPDESDKSDGGT